MTTHSLLRVSAMAAILVATLTACPGCGDGEALEPRASLPPSPEVSIAVARAAEAVWKTIDDYDAKAFAALSVEPADKTFRALEAKDVESFVKELHQKYGARAHRLFPGVAPTTSSESSTVYMMVGDLEDAVALTFVRISGAWKLSSIANADPTSIGPEAK